MSLKTRKSGIVFLVVINRGEHNGFILEENLANIWRSDNPDGWTYQQVCGPHGTILAEKDTPQKAEEILEEWLQCDAPKTGQYCYTHNPDGR